MNALTIPRMGRPAFLLVLLLLLAGVLFATPAGIALAQDEPPFGEDVVTATTTANLNIRNAPSLDGEILTTLPAGTLVGFTGLTDESGDWVQVDAANGPTGWVAAAFLSNVPDNLTVWTADDAADEEDVADEAPDQLVDLVDTFFREP